MIWAFFGVVALIAGVLCYLGTKSWPIWHMVVVFFLFMSMAGLLVLASMALKTHREWGEEFAEYERKVLDAEQAIARLGESNSLLSSQEALNNLPGVTEALSETVIDRGRVWRNVTPADVQPERITLDMTNWGDRRCARVGLGDEEEFEPEPEAVEGEGGAAGESGAAAPAAISTHQISESMILYAFRETPISELNAEQRTALFGENSTLVENDTNGVCRLPTVFISDLRVVEVNENNVVVAPLSTLDEFQQTALADSQGATWTLYELMPLDGHQVFTNLGNGAAAIGNDGEVDDGEVDDGDVDDGEGSDVVGTDVVGTDGVGEQPSADPLFARRRLLTALIPQASMPGISQADYDQLIDNYARDQRPAAAGDPPTETLTQVRFLQEHSIDVDLEDSESGAETSYDPSGRAQLPHLRHGSAVTFQPGDEQYFDAETAQRLVREGRCELTDAPKLYSRPLVDYVLFFHENQMQLDRLANQITTLTADSRDVIAAAEKARGQIAYRTAEKAKLESDRENFQREVSIVNNLLAKLQIQRKVQQEQISASSARTETSRANCRRFHALV